MDSTKEVAWDYSKNGTNAQISNMVSVLGAVGIADGSWSLNYDTGMLVIRKASSATSQVITSYKIRNSGASSGGGSSTYTDENGNVLPIKRFKADIAASQTDANIITAVASKKLRILSIEFVCGSTGTDITFQSNSTAISCKYANGANGGAVMNRHDGGHFETTSGEAFKCTTGAGSATGVHGTYVEV